VPVRAEQIRRAVIARLRLDDPRVASSVLRQATCLAHAVYFEARGETRLGQLAVAFVVMNRLYSPAYPKTICDVILDKGQFPWVTGDLTIADQRSFAIARSVALHVMAGVFVDPTAGSTHFFAPALVAPPAWAAPEAFEATIGGHDFYRLP
jgi:N-acetylmuramoyl-L-alanine amidase